MYTTSSTERASTSMSQRCLLVVAETVPRLSSLNPRLILTTKVHTYTLQMREVETCTFTKSIFEAYSKHIRPEKQQVTSQI